MVSLDDVYRKFGEASEAAQLLETELGNLCLEFEGTEEDLFAGTNPEEAARLFLKINKSTLGQLLKRLGENATTPRMAADEFASALAARNRLSHSFYRRHNFRRNTPEGRAIMFADLESIHQALLAGYKLALALSGIDLDSVQAGQLPTRHLNLD
jgi:hypothetical protein